MCGGREGGLEIDYSLLEPFQHRGYATEAVSALVAWAARRDGVRTVAAETLPSLTRSIGVLHRVGFRQVPSRAGDTLRFERDGRRLRGSAASPFGHGRRPALHTPPSIPEKRGTGRKNGRRPVPGPPLREGPGPIGTTMAPRNWRRRRSV